MGAFFFRGRSYGEVSHEKLSTLKEQSFYKKFPKQVPLGRGFADVCGWNSWFFHVLSLEQRSGVHSMGEMETS